MKLILIDLSSICHPIWHVSGQNQNVDATSIGTIERVRALASGQPHVAICVDTGKSFRRDIDPEYKANRPAADAALHHQIKLAVDTLKTDGFPVWGVAGFEADDIIATAAAVALPKTRILSEGGTTAPFFDQVVICSSDKDLLQLVGDRVEVHSLTSGVEYTEAKVIDKFKVAPHQFVDYLALVGDTADNIKGAKGIGAKKAAELLGKYGNLEDLYAALTNHGTQFTPALATALREFEPRMKQVRELVRLRTDAPVAFEEVLHERVAEDAVFAGDDEEEPPVLGAGIGDGSAPPAAPAPAAPGTIVVPAPTPTPTVNTGATSTPEPASIHRAILAAESVAGPAKVIDVPTQRPRTEAGPMPAAGAIAIRDDSAPAPIEWEKQLEPRSYAQVKALAIDLFASKMFGAYGNAPAVMSTIMAGRELGMTAAAALRGFDIIDGKPSMKADLIRALILRSGKAEYFRCTERSATAATFKTKRVGDDEMVLRFTIEEGQQAFQGDAAKWAKSGWGKNPADMLVARAGAKLARLVYPDVVHGLYSPEELE